MYSLTLALSDSRWAALHFLKQALFAALISSSVAYFRFLPGWPGEYGSPAEILESAYLDLAYSRFAAILASSASEYVAIFHLH